MSLHDLGCTFLGANCSQSWADFFLWERLLNAHPELRGLVEVGTGEAGFSDYLYIQCQARGIEFATFDRVDMGHRHPRFYQVDVLEHPELVAGHLARPGLLFCDNGDKPREVALFAPYLHQGDLLVVHDWNTEIRRKHVKPPLAPIHEGWWDTTAIFQLP